MAGEIEIDVERLAAMRKSGESHLLLDVREEWESRTAAIREARLVPMSNVPSAIDSLPRDVPLVVMCHHGGRSLRVVTWLRAQGFANAVNLQGGIDAWSRRVDPTVAVY
jgi:rhodanese-related sulfurtransferase